LSGCAEGCAHWSCSQSGHCVLDSVVEMADPDAVVPVLDGAQPAIIADVPAAVELDVCEPTPKKRDRKRKSDSGITEVRWSNEMVEVLMKARFEEYNDIFRDAKNSRKIKDGWSRVAYRVSAASRATVDGDRCRQMFQRLQKKWRDHKPTGKSSLETGNNDPGDDVKDERFAIIQPYFSKKPGCGSSLGEANDEFPVEIEAIISESSSDDDDKQVKKLKFDAKPNKPLTPGEGIAILGHSFDGGFSSVSDGLKAIASSLSGGGSNETEIKAFLADNREALAKTNQTMEKVKLQLERMTDVQGALLQFMQSMMSANKQ